MAASDIKPTTISMYRVKGMFNGTMHELKGLRVSYCTRTNAAELIPERHDFVPSGVLIPVPIQEIPDLIEALQAILYQTTPKDV